MVKLTNEQITEIIKLYTTKRISLHTLGSMFKVAHQTIRTILKENDIPINKKGMQLKYGRDKVIEKYADKNRKDNQTFVAICKLTHKQFNDYKNISGALTDHIKICYPNIKIPSTYKRRMEFKSTGIYWHEKFFDIIDKQIAEKIKCPYCDWTTIDINNKSGAYTLHITKIHNKTIDEHLLKFPDDVIRFNTHQKYKIDEEKRQLKMLDDDNCLYCQICGKKMKAISNKHLAKHGMTPEEYKIKYNTKSLLSNTLTNINAKRLKQYNEESGVNNFISKDEKEIKQIFIDAGLDIINNDRKILKGKEIDIIIPSLKLGIEYNGNLYHSEGYGKKYPNYHLDKLIEANKSGYNLIQIFEDEWILNKDIVKHKLLHIIGQSNGKKIGARKCVIREILTKEKNDFLDLYHIQGHDTASIKFGAFYNDVLVGVMTFKPITTTEFELNRFATNYNYVISGLAGKILQHFIKLYNPKKIISFADRRWTIMKENNLYTKLNFTLVSITKPEYTYYNNKIHRVKRYHKFGFRKSALNKKYGLSMDLTEREMTKQLGYDRIWDCGLLKYELLLD